MYTSDCSCDTLIVILFSSYQFVYQKKLIKIFLTCSFNSQRNSITSINVEISNPIAGAQDRVASNQSSHAMQRSVILKRVMRLILTFNMMRLHLFNKKIKMKLQQALWKMQYSMEHISAKLSINSKMNAKQQHSAANLPFLSTPSSYIKGPVTQFALMYHVEQTLLVVNFCLTKLIKNKYILCAFDIKMKLLK